ncbi:MAG: apolipoprotein N-acyltransferase [Bacteroidales bacterium]|nr:apolipoprotein N-acyltransferase [Bacteroidales bacterium]
MKRLLHLLLATLSGLLLAAAWPDNGFNPILFIAFVPLLVIQQQLGDSGKKGMFWYAWLAFLIWNALTTWWIWNSTEWGSVAAFLLNSLFMATVFFLFHLSKKKLFNNQRGYFILLFYWITWEFFHMNWDLTWSWLNLGNGLATHPNWIQWYDITGALGGTVWILAVNIIVFQLLFSFLSKRPNTYLAVTSGLLLFLIAGPIIWSNITYKNYVEKGNPVEVMIVQPNTDPYNEQYNLSPDSLVLRYLALASEKITPNTDYVILPESALQEDIWEEYLDSSQNLNRLKNFLENYPKTAFITGATTYYNILQGETMTNAARKYHAREGYYYAYNTAFLIENKGKYQLHHKSKLTPGVEIMPSWWILKPIESLAIDLGGTVGTLGREDHPVIFNRENPSLNVTPVICYESVYGEFVSRSVRLGAAIIVVITNDGWWGNTPGYRQHLWFSVLRSIETRRDLARSANTGISAFINQRGDILQKTPYWQPAVISQTMHANTELTYYVKNGDYIGRVSAFISGLLFLVSFTQGYLRKRKSFR